MPRPSEALDTAVNVLNCTPPRINVTSPRITLSNDGMPVLLLRYASWTYCGPSMEMPTRKPLEAKRSAHSGVTRVPLV